MPKQYEFFLQIFKMNSKIGILIKRKGIEIHIPLRIFNSSVIFLPWFFILLYRFEAAIIFEKTLLLDLKNWKY